MIFSKDITPMCLYCEKGKKIYGTDDVICAKKGLVKADFHCKRFVYTPLKRKPASIYCEKEEYNQKDFEI